MADIKDCAYALGMNISGKFKRIITDNKEIQKALHIAATKYSQKIDVPQEDALIVRYPSSTARVKVVEEHYENLSPFAILLPLSFLAEEKVFDLYRRYGASVIVFDKPIRLTEKGKPTDMAWIVWGVFSGNQIIFHNIFE